MKKLTAGFRKLSLTQQIIMIIFLFIVFFFAFFFLFLSGNIDRTIRLQMYDMMESRQEAIITVLQSDSSDALKQDYFDFSVDKYQVNCIVKKDNFMIRQYQDLPIRSLRNHRKSRKMGMSSRVYINMVAGFIIIAFVW